MIMMRRLCQRAPAWATAKIGTTPFTIGKLGCTITCCSMLSDYFKGYLMPSTIAAHAEWFVEQGKEIGKIIWAALDFPTMRYAGRVYHRDDNAIKFALKDPDRAVMLEVADGSHWVVALRPTLFGNSYIVADPWTGTDVDVIKKYRNITGMAFFRRK